jgi:hypothetical protein
VFTGLGTINEAADEEDGDGGPDEEGGSPTSDRWLDVVTVGDYF